MPFRDSQGDEDEKNSHKHINKIYALIFLITRLTSLIFINTWSSDFMIVPKQH